MGYPKAVTILEQLLDKRVYPAILDIPSVSLLTDMTLVWPASV